MGTPGTAATVHCDGTRIADGAQMNRVTLPTSLLSWSAGQDINFDGNTTTEPPLQGYADWDNIDLRQVSATGSISVAGIGTGSGLSVAGGRIGFGLARR